jgi:hypothetical protein
MGKSQRTKGHAWERAVAIHFRELYPEAKRGVDQSQAGGHSPDVDETPFWIECKVGARPNLMAALRQAEARKNKSDRRPSLVAAKQDREEPTVTMRLVDFMRLLKNNGAAW